MPAGARVITPDCLDILKADVRDFASQVAQQGRWRRPEDVEAALRRYRLDTDNVIRVHSVKPETTSGA